MNERADSSDKVGRKERCCDLCGAPDEAQKGSSLKNPVCVDDDIAAAPDQAPSSPAYFADRKPRGVATEKRERNRHCHSTAVIDLTGSSSGLSSELATSLAHKAATHMVVSKSLRQIRREHLAKQSPQQHCASPDTKRRKSDERTEKLLCQGGEKSTNRQIWNLVDENGMQSDRTMSQALHADKKCVGTRALSRHPDVHADFVLAQALQAQIDEEEGRAVRTRNLHDGDSAMAQALQAKIDQQERRRRNTHLQEDEALAQTLQAMAEVERQEAAARRAASETETYDVLEDFRKGITDFLRSTDSQISGHQIVAIEANPCALVGTPLYNRFVEAWQLVEDQQVVLAFHGTAEANIESICRNGLDPKRRFGQALGPGECFGKKAMISLGYCKGGAKMLVMALLTDKSGLTTNQKDLLVINKPEHQLPLFVVTFKPATVAPTQPFQPLPLNAALPRQPTLPGLPLLPWQPMLAGFPAVRGEAVKTRKDPLPPVKLLPL